MRTKARRDTNEPAVIRTLELGGCLVQPLNIKGVPDLLVLRVRQGVGQLWLIECKDGDNAPSRQRLTADQRRFHAQWAAAPIRIVRGIEDVVEFLREKT